MKIMLICFNNVIAILLRHRSWCAYQMHGGVIFPVIEYDINEMPNQFQIESSENGI